MKDVELPKEEWLRGRELAEDLAVTLRRSRDNLLCYTEMGVAGGWIDVWAMKVAWGDRDVRAYEVKISRGDYWNDVNSGKYEKYRDYCRRFYFAVPSGLVKKTEVPDGCGLITRNANGWRTIIPATPHEAKALTVDYLLNLIREIHDRERRAIRDRLHDYSGETLTAMSAAHRAGREVAIKVSAYDRGPVSEEDPFESNRKADALSFLEAVEQLANESGVEVDHRGLPYMAEFALACLRHADTVRTCGDILSRLHFRTGEEIRQGIARIS